eukprot:TRINITY_DN7413_c0_g1_i1.p1 TRINITY_DN7413_c0_g1~~TRINITY_DN7413_c0_g1_i1.p1  ORF type:complete len:1288 (-),score=489.83 TRINITY_DN7413_c0_g1_i1:535-3900(-)
MEAAGVTVKLKDLFAVVKVCGRLHATYDDFGAQLASAVDKAYRATPVAELARRRFLLRLLVELILVECLPKENASMLQGFVKELMNISLEEEQVITNFTIVVSFVQKHSVSCLNIVPAKQKAYEEALGKSWVERTCVLEDALRAQLQNIIINAYQGSAGGLLQSAHNRFQEQEKANAKLRVDKGAVDAENEQKYQTLKESYTKLQSNLSTLSEFLNQPLPQPEDENPEATRLAAPDKNADEAGATEEVEAELLIFEDEEQRRFYEEVMDCKAVIPAVLLGLEKGAAPTAAPAPAAAAADLEVPEKPKEAKGGADEDGKTLHASDLDLYLARAAQVEGFKAVDDLVMEFFHEHNTKGARRALVYQMADLFRVPPGVLNSRARLVATVAPYIKEMASHVMTTTQKGMEKILEEKASSPESLDNKIRHVRYLGELCKFKICPPGVVLDLFKTFCDDFSQHNAEMCANMLQCCGRYLLYSPETAQRTENLLERMMRLKNVKSLQLRLEVMIEDAYYQLKPPQGKRQKMRDKEPLELFTAHIIHDRLYNEADEDKVLKLVRKLPWDGTAPKWLKKCILELNLHAKYEGICQLASLLSGLAKYHDAFVIDVIDSLCENIQTSLERNDFREAPLRVRQVKLLAELYIYRLVDSGVIFDCLYHLIGFGGPTMHRAGNFATAHRVIERVLAMRRSAAGLGSIAEEAEDANVVGGIQMPPVVCDPMHPVEQPWDFFRIKLVCVMLETCGHFFASGAGKQKLDRFLQFFLRYVITKGDLPMRVSYMVSDLLEKLRPKMSIPNDLATVDKVIAKLLQAEKESLDLSKETEADDAGANEEEEDDEDEESSEEESSSDSDSSESGDSEDSSSSDESDEEARREIVEARRDRQDYNRGAENNRQPKHQEDDEFDKEIQKMLIESLEKEKVKSVNIKAADDLLAPPPVGQIKQDVSRPPGGFSLMQRKPGQGKVIMRQIDIPEDSKLARVSAGAAPTEDSKEKEELKRYIIQYDRLNAVAGGIGQGSLQIQLRPGKGAGKAAKAASGGGGGPRRKADEYLKDNLLPEEARQAVPTMHVATRSGKGGGSGPGGAGKAPPASRSSRAPAGSSGSGGGKGGSSSRPAGKGTPSQQSRQAL